jgi:hypothetical protein
VSAIANGVGNASIFSSEGASDYDPVNSSFAFAKEAGARESVTVSSVRHVEVAGSGSVNDGACLRDCCAHPSHHHGGAVCHSMTWTRRRDHLSPSQGHVNQERCPCSEDNLVADSELRHEEVNNGNSTFL